MAQRGSSIGAAGRVRFAHAHAFSQGGVRRVSFYLYPAGDRKRHMQQWKIGFAVGAAGLAAAALGTTGSAQAVRGETPPDFSGTALDGRKVALSEFRGKNPVVLNFYADFCAPCRKEFPHLKALDEKFSGKGLRVVAVSLDADRATAAAIPNAQKVKFPVVFDPKGAIAEKYQVQAIPHTVVIRRDGTVHTVLTGLDLEGLDRAVAAVLK